MYRLDVWQKALNWRWWLPQTIRGVKPVHQTLVSREVQGRKGWIQVVPLTGKPHLATQVH